MIYSWWHRYLSWRLHACYFGLRIISHLLWLNIILTWIALIVSTTSSLIIGALSIHLRSTWTSFWLELRCVDVHILVKLIHKLMMSGGRVWLLLLLMILITIPNDILHVTLVKLFTLQHHFQIMFHQKPTYVLIIYAELLLHDFIKSPLPLFFCLHSDIIWAVNLLVDQLLNKLVSTP
jgi:hypothetical protein